MSRDGVQTCEATLPPIDTALLHSRCMGNQSFALALLAELEATGAHRVDAIGRHASEGKIKDAADVAHALRGAAAILGATVLQGIATDIEVAGHSGEMDCVLKKVDELRREWERCAAFIPVVRANATRR